MTHMDHDIHPTRDEGHHDKPVAPLAGVVYGDIIYWITILATLFVILGSTIAFVTNNNYIDPSYMLSSIWQGKSVEEIWQGAIGGQPEGHWYLPHLLTGNGMAAGGIALGVFSVIPAILASAVILFKRKERLFGTLAVIAAIITTATLFS